MKMLTVFLAIVVLLTLAACGDNVDAGENFDAEAEKEAVVAVSVGLNDDFANADGEAILAACHEDIDGLYVLSRCPRIMGFPGFRRGFVHRAGYY